MTFALTDHDKRILLQTAREAIGSRLSCRQPSYPAATPMLSEPCGAFVTLKEGDSLRGCIGHITAADPLIETIKQVARSSAFEDPRFPPVSPGEWGRIWVEISVLSPFVRIRDVHSIEVGVHGIMIRSGGRSGLLLPQVATEQGWDRETFLEHTCMKAGLQKDSWRSPDAWIEIFSAIVFHEQRQ
jgi:AmmeMemoRadiSam system protein A